MVIYFYSVTDKEGYLSNFSRHSFELEGKYWETVEHYFQAQKFIGTPLEEKIRKSPTPKQAKALGQSRSIALRLDWEEVKNQKMLNAIRKKFQTHQDIRLKLISTGNEELIESSPNDFYWGCGSDGSGKNMTGFLLMQVRTELSNVL